MATTFEKISHNFKPKILLLHIVDRPEQFAGAERVALDIAKGLRESGIPCALAVNRGMMLDEAKRSQIEVLPIDLPGRRDLLRWFFAIRSLTISFRPEIVHSHHRFTTFLAHLIPYRKFVLLHTFHVEQFTRKWMQRFGDHTTAVSQGVKDHFVTHFGVSPEKITVIYNGLTLPERKGWQDVTTFQPKTSGQVNIAVVGRLEKQKGHEILIRAMDHLPEDKRKRINLIFLGEGSKRSVIEKMIRKRGWDNIQLTGFTENVSAYLEDSDFTVLPSLWEGLGLSILESYLHEKPVIASRVGGIPEVVQDGETGILVPPKDPRELANAIETLMDSPEKIKQLGMKGKKMALENFSINKMIDGYQRIYFEILKKRPN